MFIHYLTIGQVEFGVEIRVLQWSITFSAISHYHSQQICTLL